MQFCGSMTFLCGSGSADPCFWLMDPDSDPAIFIIDLQDTNKKLIYKKKFFCILLFKGTFTSFFKDKKSKRSHKTVEIKVFLTLFAKWSRRPKNMRMRHSGIMYIVHVIQSQQHLPDLDPDPYSDLDWIRTHLRHAIDCSPSMEVTEMILSVVESQTWVSFRS